MVRANVRRLIIGSLTTQMMTGFFGDACRASDPTDARFQERWVYCSQNLLVDQNVDRVIDLLERAAKSGYTAMMLADYKYQILDRVDERHFRNAERVKAAATAKSSPAISTRTISLARSLEVRRTGCRWHLRLHVQDMASQVWPTRAIRAGVAVGSISCSLQALSRRGSKAKRRYRSTMFRLTESAERPRAREGQGEQKSGSRTFGQ